MPSACSGVVSNFVWCWKKEIFVPQLYYGDPASQVVDFVAVCLLVLRVHGGWLK
jgi:hypothetical protein